MKLKHVFFQQHGGNKAICTEDGAIAIMRIDDGWTVFVDDNGKFVKCCSMAELKEAIDLIEFASQFSPDPPLAP